MKAPNAGDDLPWNGDFYARGIASVFLKDGQLCAAANTNEMIVHLFSALHPLSLYVRRREAPNDDPLPTHPVAN